MIRHPVWTGFLLFALIFSLYPQLDLWIASLAWQDGFERSNPLVLGLYSAFQGVLGYYLLFFLVTIGLPSWLLSWQHRRLAAGAVTPWLRRWNESAPIRWLRRHQRDLVFLLLVLIIGAVVVEVLMKGFWGRPRPYSLTEFGGSQQFVPFLQVADACQRNCSFASGHAAIGFYFMALAWPLKSRWWLVPGLLLGAALAYVRIAMGGHFFTDVVTSGFVIYGICWGLAKVFYPANKKSKK